MEMLEGMLVEVKQVKEKYLHMKGGVKKGKVKISQRLPDPSPLSEQRS